MKEPAQTKLPWHTMTIEAVCSELKSASTGLTCDEAALRLEEYGPNELQAAAQTSHWTILFAQFKNVLIIILLVATLLSAFLGHGIEAAAIAVIVMFAVVLGFVQEFRAERAIESLRKMAAPTATVLRDGLEVEAPARELVIGDLIILRAGDRMPSDARLTEAVNLQIEEAALTGESLPSEKQTAPLSNPELTLGDRRNMAYAGTAISYGRGRAIITETGMNTEFGKIAKMLQTVETGKTPLQKNLDKVGSTLAKAAIVVVGLIVALGLFRGQPFIDMLIFGIALAVAVVPEALPAVVTISLAIGVQRMVKRNALMRRLPAVETLGSTSIICSDKTGTLTKDEMTVRKIFTSGEMIEVSGAGYEPKGSFLSQGKTVEASLPMRELLTAAVLASDAHIIYNEAEGRWQVKGDPTEGAFVTAAAKAGINKSELELKFNRTDEIPFTSETKRMTTINTGHEGTIACSKGASEVILASCSRVMTAKGEVPLDDQTRKTILDAGRSMAGDALRVLGVSFKPGADSKNAEHDMIFLGLAGMIDPPRPEARLSIQKCEQAGIRAVMITGDHPVTASAIARDLGLLKAGRSITGAELEAMSEEEFEREVENIEVYARVAPAHKLRVVTALQKKGHVVAMTGDGVNDAPALKKADIGIAMGITGTDVTKEASAMMLTDDNFASIVAAVEEGRGIFDNIKKYLMYLLSSNIGEIGLMAGASLAGLPLPLSAVQILTVNLATDGLPALALAVDPPEQDLMNRPPRNPKESIFTRAVTILMLTGGFWSTAINLGLFTWMLNSGRGIREAMAMTFISLVLIQFFKAYSFRSDRHSVFNRPFANKWLNLAIVVDFAMLVFIIYLPSLQTPFVTFSLTMVDWILVTSLAATVIPVLEIVKWLERRL